MGYIDLDIAMRYGTSMWDVVYRYGHPTYRYVYPGYRYGIRDIDIGDDSMDIVTLP